MSPYGTDVITFHVRNPCGRLGQGGRGEESTSFLPPSRLLEGVIYTSFASGRIERNTMLTTRPWKGDEGKTADSPGLPLPVTDIQGGIEVASPRDCIDEVICDYVGIAIIRHNYYYC